MILVVDDEDDTRTALVRLINRAGCEALGVADGQAALIFLETALPTLIILDLRMPVLDGLDVLREIRREPRTTGIPVVVFTAEAAESSCDEAMAAGAQAFIRKGSSDWPDLLACIERHSGGPPRATDA